MKRFLQSIGYGWDGIVYLARTQRNARYHAVLYGVVILIGILIGVSITGMAIVTLASGLLFAFEAVNTVVEETFDFFHPRYHRKVGSIKDMASGISLIMGITYAIVTAVLYGHRVVELIRGARL